MITVVTTPHKKEDAVRIGRGLLEKRLIACYNLWPIESAYWWKGQIEEQPEAMMLLKTQANHFDQLAAYIKERSSYEVPDIFALQPSQTHPAFASWVEDETTQK